MCELIQKFLVGSVLILVSVALLRGPLSHLQHMMTKERIPFTVSYVGSMGMTLYAAIGVSFFIFFLLCVYILLKIYCVVATNDFNNFVCNYSNNCFALVRRIVYSWWHFYIKIRYILYRRKSCFHFTHLKITLYFLYTHTHTYIFC